MSEFPDKDAPDAAARLQQAFGNLLGTFGGGQDGRETAASPRDSAADQAVGIGRAMVTGAANAGAGETQTFARSVEEDIAMGTSPWLAHLRHNRQDGEHPLVVGFYQDETGALRPLYGTNTFTSERQVEPDPFQSHTTEKQVSMLTGEFTHVQSPNVVRSEYWNALPADLREHFEQGEILVTTGRDLYASGTMPPGEELAAQEGSYCMMYYGTAYGDGRTGVVMRVTNGELQPVKTVIDDLEYVLELKGCGTRQGGFGPTHFRTGREIVTGGDEAEQMLRELARLTDDSQAGAPKAVGGILFENPALTAEDGGVYEQGYTIRLSPSTVRASYAAEGVYPDIKSPGMVERVLDMYTAQFAEHLFGDPPKILNASSHTENILLWGDGKYTFTDYSDHAAFADPNFPNSRTDPREMLEYYTQMVTEIPGMKRAHVSGFFRRLSEEFSRRGLHVGLTDKDTYARAAERIWDNAMAYQVYKGRKASGYTPDAMIQDHLASFNDFGIVHAVDRSSAEGMTACVAVAQDRLQGAVQTMRKQGVGIPAPLGTQAIVATIESANFSQLNDIAGQLKAAYRQVSDYVPYEDQRAVHEALSFYSAFDNFTRHMPREYLKHELDVLTTAQRHCPEEERAGIIATETQVRQKLEYLETIADTDIAALYNIVKDADSLRAFLQPDAYKAA